MYCTLDPLDYHPHPASASPSRRPSALSPLLADFLMAQTPALGALKDTVVPDVSHNPPPRTVLDEPLPSAAEFASYTPAQLLPFLQPILEALSSEALATFSAGMFTGGCLLDVAESYGILQFAEICGIPRGPSAHLHLKLRRMLASGSLGNKSRASFTRGVASSMISQKRVYCLSNNFRHMSVFGIANLYIKAYEKRLQKPPATRDPRRMHSGRILSRRPVVCSIPIETAYLLTEAFSNQLDARRYRSSFKSGSLCRLN